MIISLAVFSLLTADGNWQQLSSNDGYLLERRPVPGNPYYEYRVTTETDLSVGTLCDEMYEWGSVSRDHEELKSRRLLEDHGDYRISYDQIATPGPVAPRDFAFAVKKDKRKDGTCRVDFYTVNDKAPPLQPGWVRLAKLRGHWEFVPVDGQSRTRVVYYLFSDPGGNLPAGFVHGPQQAAALNTVKKGLRIARSGTTGAQR